MDYQPCFLCGEKSFFIFSSLDRDQSPISLVICNKCSFLQVNPRISSLDQKKFYQGSYHSKAVGGFEPSEKFKLNTQRLARERVELLKQFVNDAKISLLDIGCSYGEFMNTMKPFVKTMKGIEPGIEYGAYGIDKFHLDIFQGTLEDYETGIPELYDIVTCFTVLEHVFDPNTFLKKINSLLAVNGLLFLEVPDYLSFFKKLRSKRKGYSFFSPYHINYFTANTLTAILLRNGFTNIRIHSDRPKYLRVFASKVHEEKKINVEKTVIKDNLYYLKLIKYFWKIKNKILVEN